MSSRVGAPRQSGERFPSGKLKPKPKPTGEPIQPALWQRVRSDAAKLACDDRLASEIGRLSFHRELTDTQVAAALRVSAIYGSWERQNGLTRRTRSPSYESGIGGGQRDISDDQARAVTAAYAALDEELKLYPSAWREMLERLCCNDEFLPSEWLLGIKRMLDDLAVFFGVSKSRKREHVRKLPRPMPHIQPSAQTAPVFKAIPTDKAAYLALLTHLRPDLDEAGRERSWDIFQAMKDREQFNRSKGKR